MPIVVQHGRVRPMLRLARQAGQADQEEMDRQFGLREEGLAFQRAAEPRRGTREEKRLKLTEYHRLKSREGQEQERLARAQRFEKSIYQQEAGRKQAALLAREQRTAVTKRTGMGIEGMKLKEVRVQKRRQADLVRKVALNQLETVYESTIAGLDRQDEALLLDEKMPASKRAAEELRIAGLRREALKGRFEGERKIVGDTQNADVPEPGDGKDADATADIGRLKEAATSAGLQLSGPAWESVMAMYDEARKGNVDAQKFLKDTFGFLLQPG